MTTPSATKSPTPNANLATLANLPDDDGDDDDDDGDEVSVEVVTGPVGDGVKVMTRDRAAR